MTMTACIHPIAEERARRLWRVWVDARAAAVERPGVEQWRRAVMAWDEFKAAYDKVG